MNVAFIGAGAMAQAISKGANTANPDRWNFSFFDPNMEVAKSAANAVSGHQADSLDSLLSGADMVVLAVKPQIQSSVIRELPGFVGCCVSIAAGRSLNDIQEDFSVAGLPEQPLVRVMPNINAFVGQATSAVCPGQYVDDHQYSEARALFDAIGETFEVPEKLFPAFTAMAGSSPAWFFRIIDHLAYAGVQHGLTKEQATAAATSTMAGSAAMLLQHLEQGGHPEQLVDRVCSPGGTTIAGLLAAEDAGLSRALTEAVGATVHRDQELANQ